VAQEEVQESVFPEISWQHQRRLRSIADGSVHQFATRSRNAQGRDYVSVSRGWGRR